MLGGGYTDVLQITNIYCFFIKKINIAFIKFKKKVFNDCNVFISKRFITLKKKYILK